MSEYRTVGVVGLGRMGLTLASGFGRAVGPARVYAAVRSPAGADRLRETVPGATVVPLPELAGHARLLVLCVRNADLPEVLDTLRPRLTERHLVITVNNGLPLRTLAEAVPGPVAKLVPSVGNEIGAGATLLVPGPRLTAPGAEELLGLLRAFSEPYVIEEGQGRTATDLASCGPALLAGAARAMVAAQREGGAPLPDDLAERLVTQ
ncbi:NAD(P)-binding domain-containing protein, partial [Streptomyces sp. UH6]|uniref:NAD(P)-binding domain-containing protein n=1 Tax=Streptomyces sp. UH6 TaxID=2748379 RepID=UPI0015D4FEE3